MKLNEKLSRATWPVFVLTTVKSGKSVKDLRSWLKDNMVGEYFIRSCQETLPNNKKKTIATLIRIKDESDAVIFKLRWASYE